MTIAFSQRIDQEMNLTCPIKLDEELADFIEFRGAGQVFVVYPEVKANVTKLTIG